MLSFPFELIEEVVDLSSNATLASWALVSRDLLELSRSRLYRSVTMSSLYIPRPPAGIATTTSHLLRYVRHLEISFPYERPQAASQDIIQIVQKLIGYGSLTAIWFNSPDGFWESGFWTYIHHLVPLLRMESVKYIRTPLVAPRVREGYRYQEEKEFLENLFLSKACLDLDYISRDDARLLPQLIFPAIQSQKPSIHTLRLHFQLGPVNLRKSWKWLTSHVDLGSRLRRLQISIALYEEDVGGSSGIWSELKNSLPQGLSELSIFGPGTTHLIRFLSKFPIECFHSLNILSVSFFTHDDDNDSAVNSYLTALIQFMQRVSPSSRDTLREINFCVNPFPSDENLISDESMMKWKTLGEVIANCFPSSLQTTLYTSPPAFCDVVQYFAENFISGLHTARIRQDLPMGPLVFSVDSQDSWRDVMWEQANGLPVHNPYC